MDNIEKPIKKIECLICYNKCDKLVTFYPCYHKNICYICSKKIDKCSLCRSDIKEKSYPNIEEVYFEKTRLSQLLFNRLNCYIKLLSNKELLDGFIINDEISNIYKGLNEKYLRITVEQTHELLDIINNLHIENIHEIHHRLVCLCILPYNVKVAKANSGVCYNGHMGDRCIRISCVLSFIELNERRISLSFSESRDDKLLKKFCC